jgi:multidrug efflux pump subunit AcrB
MNTPQTRGLIALFSRHRVAGNLLMAFMLILGSWGLTQLNRQSMPDFALDVITIAVQWPGASPEDLESNVIKAIEAAVRFIDDVHRVDAIAVEGRADVTIEFDEQVDISRALTEVQAAIARINTFPSDIERPVVSQLTSYESVCWIEVSGPFPEHALKTYARRIRGDLLNLGVAHVNLHGMRNAEIWVELQPAVLRRLDLQLADVAQRVEESSLDLPAGSIDASGVSRQIRSKSLARSADDVGKIEAMFGTGGERLQLRDIARIRETFDKDAVTKLLDGRTAILLQVMRARGIDSIGSQRLVTSYLDGIRKELPPTLNAEIFDVAADQVRQRLRMLIKNSISGLLLVLLMLFLFLNARLAVWVAMGLPVAIMATFGGMAMFGMSLNMISIFAIIMGLGIIVDDAIVVAEHAEMLHRNGMQAEDAALRAARVMLVPVLAASLTTMAAVYPILTVGTAVGRVVRDLPLTIIMVVGASLLECFLVLPSHLKHALQRVARSPRKTSLMNEWFLRFRENRFAALAGSCYRRRYSTVITTLCALLLSLTLLIFGHVGFQFFPSPQSDALFANIAMTPGTPRERTAEILEEIARALQAAEDELTGGAGGVVRHQYGTLGATAGRTGERVLSGEHVGAYNVELMPGDVRRVRNNQLLAAWEKHIRPIPGVERVTLLERKTATPPGREIDIRIYGAPLPVLKSAAEELQRGLRQFPGTMGVEDNLPYGKDEILLRLNPAGRAMGFTEQSMARQVRNGFEGLIARRFAIDEEERIVRVKLSESSISRTNIQDLYLRAPDANWVPLAEVATLGQRVGFSQVLREDGRREVSVIADIDVSVTTGNEVLAGLKRDVIPAVREKYGVDMAFMGKARDQQEALADTAIALAIAITMMYLILALVFRSYTTPVAVMSIIPFGLVGAIFGHWVMGYNLNMLSLMALLGLAGVMINDSIILISAVKQQHAVGVSMSLAVIGAAKERLRPTLLTTLTTIGGLLPLLFESSIQARLVQPLAVTLIFGLLLEPALVLLFVPAILGIGNDFHLAIARRRKIWSTTLAEEGLRES